MPTDALVRLRDVMLETRAPTAFEGAPGADQLGRPGARPAGIARFPQRGGRGLEGARRGRELHHGPGIQNASSSFAVAGRRHLGRAAAVRRGAGLPSFRIGLFGLEKWHNVERTVGHLRTA